MTSLAVERLTVRAGEARLLDAVSLVAGAGEFVGVVGPNGAGKSTLLRAAAGAEHAHQGSVLINDVEIAAMTAISRARALAYLPQTREINWAITAEAVVTLGRFAYGSTARLDAAGRAAVDAALAATDSELFRDRVASTLSGGEQARVHLARALAAEAPILIADEPTAALDLKHALAILTLLRAKARAGGLVIAALHDLGMAYHFCSRLIVLNGGRVVADGAPEQALTQGLLGEVFGVCLDDLARLEMSAALEKQNRSLNEA